VAIISNGTTIADAGAFSASLGSMVLIKTLTASSSGTLSFVDGSASVVLDNTYPIYVFKFFDIHPATNAAEISFNVSIDSGSNYNVAKTTTCHRSYHTEDDNNATLDYVGDFDLAQGTGFQPLALNQGNANDESAVGTLTLFNPSSTTFVKHFIFSGNNSHDASNPGAVSGFFAGYANTTSAVDAIQFKMSTGNIDAGTIKMYGIKDS
jgi:hypothetical protein